jgi:hypothetical protein
MVICPVAIAIGCRRCPIFAACPVKKAIGDYKPPAPETQPRVAAKKRRAKKVSARRGGRKSR